MVDTKIWNMHEHNSWGDMCRWREGGKAVDGCMTPMPQEGHLLLFKDRHFKITKLHKMGNPADGFIADVVEVKNG